MSPDRRPRRRSPRGRIRLEALERRELMTVQFSSTSYTFGNTASSAVITLVRSPNPIMDPEVAQVATTGGTARPDMDYTPVSQNVTFQQGEFTKQVTIPLLTAGQTGTIDRTVQLAVSSQDNMGNPVESDATINLIPRADITPPTITDAVQLRQKGLLTGFKITFSKDMDPTTVENVKNYVVQGYTIPKGGFSLSPKPKSTAYAVNLSRAEYDPTTRTVILTVKRPQAPGAGYTITNPQTTDDQGNALPSALTDAAGNLLDLNGDGQPDGLLSLQVARTTHDFRTLNIPAKAVKAAKKAALAAAAESKKGLKLPIALSSQSNSPSY
jgi:hypothetical protein